MLQPFNPALGSRNAGSNTRRAIAHLQSHPDEPVHHGAKRWCKHGHEFTPDNTGIEKSDGRRRYCKTCRRLSVDALRARTQQRRGRQWHIDEGLFLALADQYPPVLGEPPLSTAEVGELLQVRPNTLNSWCRRNPHLAPPLSSTRRARLWTESHARHLLAARTDETWPKPRRTNTPNSG